MPLAPKVVVYSVFCGSTETLMQDIARRDGPARIVVTPNLDHWRMLSRHSAFRRAYRNADLLVNDSRFLDRLVFHGRTLLMPGSDLVPEVLGGSEVGLKICVIGYSEDVRRFLLETYPHLAFTFINPSMGYISDRRERREIVETISAAAPNLVLVCTGAPRSEILAASIKRRVDRPMTIICCGSALIFLAGSKSRAPKLFRRAGAEWLWRFLSEPHTRLRYAMDVAFLVRNALSLHRLYATGSAGFPHYRIAFDAHPKASDGNAVPK